MSMSSLPMILYLGIPIGLAIATAHMSRLRDVLALAPAKVRLTGRARRGDEPRPSGRVRTINGR